MKKILFKFGLSLNWIFAVLLIFSDLSVFVSPDIIPYVALLGLFFPFLVLINLLFLFFKIFSGSKYFLISLFALLLSYNRIKDSYAFGNKKVVKALINPVKVMSYNVRLFDLYNWTGNNCGDSIVNLIKKENPDILCLQEFYSSDKKNYREVIIKSLGAKAHIVSSKNKNGYSGNAIFSRYPIVSSGFVDTDSNKQKCIFADIVINGDTVRVYGIHLASIHLDNDDYEFMKGINTEDKKKNLEGVKSISGKLLDAYKIRSEEVGVLSPHIASSPYPAIVCGDFNDTPVSYTYRRIKGDLVDAFSVSGSGTGCTYAKSFPVFRIDYILHDKSMTSNSFKRIKKTYSDHYPVSCVVEL